MAAKAGEHAFEAAHGKLAAQYEPHERDGAVWLPASAHIVSGAA